MTTSALDVGALNAVETRLEARGVAVCHAHALLLGDVLELHRVLSAAGAGLSTAPQAALLLQVSEHAVRAQRCDLDHDRAHPHGPTCACNLGPLCRRHHRVEQLLMCKTRVDGGAVRWTSPTGRSWTSPAQHQPPGHAVRRPAVTVDEPDLSPQAFAELLADADDDPRRLELRAAATCPTDRFGDAIRDDPDGWGHELDDPYRWNA